MDSSFLLLKDIYGIYHIYHLHSTVSKGAGESIEYGHSVAYISDRE